MASDALFRAKVPPFMKVDYDTALEIASHEAIVREAYKDSVGTWTWSVGLTNATGHNVERYIDKPQSLEHCLAVYVWALENYAEAVRAEFRDHPLTKEQFAAALSFHWNTGAIKSASWPDLFKQGDIAEARESFLSWRKPPEIIMRRRKECDLFFKGTWSSDGKVTEYAVSKPSYKPNWSSARRINIERELRAAFDAAPPDEPPSQGWAAAIGALVMAILGGIAKLFGWI